jgi:hypothetical protein
MIFWTACIRDLTAYSLDKNAIRRRKEIIKSKNQINEFGLRSRDE